MARKLKFPNVRTDARDAIILTGTIVIGGSGAISSVTGFVPSAAAGVSPGVVKTAAKTGRYTVTLDRKYKFIRPVGEPAIVGPTDVGFGNTNANLAQYRNLGTQSFDIQLMLASTGVDTDAASGYIVTWAVAVGEL